MRRIAATFVTAALVVGAGALAAPAGASTPTKTSPFCRAVKNVKLSSVSGGGANTATAAKLAKQLNKVAAKANGNIKAATKTLAKAFQDLADGGSPRDLVNAKYIKAAATFGLAAAKCAVAGLNLPDNITLPKNITLPGN